MPFLVLKNDEYGTIKWGLTPLGITNREHRKIFKK